MLHVQLWLAALIVKVLTSANNALRITIILVGIDATYIQVLFGTVKPALALAFAQAVIK